MIEKQGAQPVQPIDLETQDLASLVLPDVPALEQQVTVVSVATIRRRLNRDRQTIFPQQANEAIKKLIAGEVILVKDQSEEAPTAKRVRKVYGYWKNPENIENEIKVHLAQGGKLTHTSLKNSDKKNVSGAIVKNYPGGIRALQKKLEQPTGRKEPGYWQNPETIENEIRMHLAQGGKLTHPSLIESARSDLINAVRDYYPGGLKALQQKLEQPIAGKESGYWKNPENIENEIRMHLAEGGKLNVISFRDSNRSDLINAIRRHYPGGIRALQKKLEQPIAGKESGYWQNPENIENEIRVHLAQGGKLTYTSLHELNRSSLGSAINKHYPGGINALQQRFEQPVNHKKGYWQNIENIENEARALFSEGEKLTKKSFTQSNRLVLEYAIRKYYPGGMKALKEKLGLTEKTLSISPQEANEYLKSLIGE